MRPIKFRGWNPDKKQMLYWDVFESFESNIYYHIWNYCTNYMQFTGLTDKNGKEIYEGDICKIQDKYIGVCEYSFNGFNFGRILVLFEYNKKNQKEVEIIGNIHENPDLIHKI